MKRSLLYEAGIGLVLTVGLVSYGWKKESPSQPIQEHTPQKSASVTPEYKLETYDASKDPEFVARVKKLEEITNSFKEHQKEFSIEDIRKIIYD